MRYNLRQAARTTVRTVDKLQDGLPLSFQPGDRSLEATMQLSTWITCEEAKALCGLSQRTLFNMSCETPGCPSLNHPLRKHNVQNGRIRRVEYLRADVEKLARIPSLDDGQFEDNAGIWLTTARACRDFGFNERALTQHRKRSPILKRKLEAKQIWVRETGSSKKNFHEVWVHFLDDLKAIHGALLESLPDGDDENIRPEVGEKEFGFDAQTIRYWGRNGHPALNNRTVHTTLGGKARVGNGRVLNTQLFSRRDLNRIRDWQERNGGELDESVTAHWVKVNLNISRGLIGDWCKKGHPALEGRSPLSKLELRMVAGRKHFREHRVFHLGDLKRIAEFRKGKPPEAETPVMPVAARKNATAPAKSKGGRPRKWNALRKIIDSLPVGTSNASIAATYNQHYAAPIKAETMERADGDRVCNVKARMSADARNHALQNFR